MARSMGGGGSRGSGRSSGGGSRSSSSRSSSSRSSSRSMGSSRSGTSRTFGSGHSGGSAARGGGRSYSGQTSSGNPMMGGGYNRPSGGHYGGNHGGYHNPPPPPPPRRRYYGYGRRRYYYDGPNRVYVNNYSGGSSGSGCSSVFAMLIVIIILIAFVGSMQSYNRTYQDYYNNKAPSYSDSYSNVEREKFTGKVNVNGFYSDPDGLLYDDEKSPMEQGLKHFYNTTGVCAYVYLVEELDSDIDGIEEASALYDELFSDEGHILLLYDYNNAIMYDACGYAIATTLDDEAIDILYDYIEAEWSSDSENLGNIFGGGCAKAADRIMHKQKTFGERYKGIIIALIAGITVIIVISIGFKWWKKRIAQKNKEQEDLERTLSTPLETFGTSTSDLEKKYDDDPSND